MKKNKKEALKRLCIAGEQGNYAALLELIDIYRKGKLANNAELLKWLHIAADYEHDFALKELGLMYYEGVGVEQDYAEAAKLFQKAFEQQYDAAADKLGLMYLEGLGVPQDYVMAAKCFEREALFGNKDCQQRLLEMYKNGLIHVSDDIEIVKRFQQAEEGDEDLQLVL